MRRVAGPPWSRFATADRAGPDLGRDQQGRVALDGAEQGDQRPTLIRFLQRLIQDARRKLFLIVDRLQVYRAKQVRDWLAAHRARIELFYLPPYSPELNPDQGLNADLKQAVTRKVPARSKQQTRSPEAQIDRIEDVRQDHNEGR